MAYTITTSASTLCVNDLLSTKSEFRLPLTELKNKTTLLQPSTFITQIAASSQKTFDLVPLGSKVRLLSFKATRPVSVFLVTETKEFELPRSTFFSYLVDSQELSLEAIESVRVEVPAAATTAPSPLPSLYPDVVFELLAVLETPAA